MLAPGEARKNREVLTSEGGSRRGWVGMGVFGPHPDPATWASLHEVPPVFSLREGTR